MGKALSSARRIAVGYAFQNRQCENDALYHEHVKQRDGTYVCEHECRRCAQCDVPHPKPWQQGDPCWGCKELARGTGPVHRIGEE